MNKIYYIAGGLIILLGGLYIFYNRQIALLKEYTWKIKSFKLRKLSLTELSLDITFLFTSKADIEASINKVYFDIFIEGQNVGFIKEERKFIIPANGTSEVPIFVSVNPQSILKNIIGVSLGAAQKKDIAFKLQGYANISSGVLSTTLPIVYETTIKQYLGLLPVK